MIAQSKKRFYTAEENAQFYMEAAVRYLRLHPGMQPSEIFDGNNLNRYNFFRRYYQEYYWSRGVWSAKSDVKRMCDGIQRFFVQHFEAAIGFYIQKGIESS